MRPERSRMKLGRLFVLMVVVIGLSAAVCAASVLQNASDHKVLFEKAKFTMETKGDLQGAIKLFQEIIAKYPQEKEYAARAQLYVGLCYEKLGNSEAIKAYELVLNNYSDRPEEVSIARERLAVLRQEAISRLSVVQLSLGDGHTNWDLIALSPDGTKLLVEDYEMGNNIAYYDYITNRKVPLTHFDNSDKSYYAESPIWSPDGKQVAYAQATLHHAPDVYELRVSTLDGKSRAIYTAQEEWMTPCGWLPDENAIVAISWDEMNPKALGLVPLSGGPFKAFFSIPAEWSMETASVSPDGRFVALEGGPAGSQNIHIVSVRDQSSWIVADHPADDRDPRWSPDGKHIVFLSLRNGGRALWGLAMKDGKPAGEPFMIKDGMPNAYLLNWTANGLAFGNWIDVKDIFIQAVNPGTNELIGRPQLLSYRLTGSNVSPSWSPDGKFLAFASISTYGDLPSRGHIIVMPADGGQAREFLLPLAHPLSPILYPNIRWLPDSSGLGYTIKDEKGQETLVRLNVKTGEWKTFSIPTKFFTDIEWSGDGNSYYYAKHRHYERFEPEPGIIEHNLDTGKERYVYRPEKGKGAVLRSFRCSRDYKGLVIEQVDYVQNQVKETCQILALDLESGKVQSVTPALEGPVPNDWMRFAWPCWSPDRKNFLVSYNHTEISAAKELALIPAAGGTLRKLPINLNYPAGEDFRSGFWTFDWSPDGKKIAFAVRSSKDEAFLMKNVIVEKK